MKSVKDDLWLLPAGIEEVLPRQARILESLRRDLLGLYGAWGYELVIPPIIDNLDALLVGSGRELDLQTLKLTDQVSGRTLGIRADMTPQVARMDAHTLRRAAPTRLCYLGTVLHARPDGFASTRSPLQLGAELFGHAGIESDTEIVRLLMLTLSTAGVADCYLDLGHVGIFRGLARQAELTGEQEYRLFDALQRKAVSEIETLVGEFALAAPLARMLVALAELNGADALERAGQVLAGAAEPVHAALSYLRRLARELGRWLPDVPVHYDLAELRGYHYKTGVVFAAFASDWGLEIARGGRYDAIGRAFGRARPAVGFSTDLKGLLRHSRGLAERYPRSPGVLAPWSPDPALQDAIADLRERGWRVICALPGSDCDPGLLDCQRQLVERDGQWVVQSIPTDNEPKEAP